MPAPARGSKPGARRSGEVVDGRWRRRRPPAGPASRRPGPRARPLRPRRPPWPGGAASRSLRSAVRWRATSSFLRARSAARAACPLRLLALGFLAAAAADGFVGAVGPLGGAWPAPGLGGSAWRRPWPSASASARAAGRASSGGTVGVDAEPEAGLLLLGDEHATTELVGHVVVERRHPDRGEEGRAWSRRPGSPRWAAAAFTTALAAARSAAVAARSSPGRPATAASLAARSCCPASIAAATSVRLLARHLVQRPRRHAGPPQLGHRGRLVLAPVRLQLLRPAPFRAATNSSGRTA